MKKTIYEKFEVFDDLIEGIQVIDDNFKYYYVNNSLAKQGKSSKEELVGKTMMEKYPGIEKTSVFEQIATCMKYSSAADLTNEFKFQDGSIEYFKLRIQRISEGVLIMSYNITEQRKAELELEKNLEERTKMLAVISDQKKQLEDFCNIIAHNMRAPLTNLLLLCDMIKNSNDEAEKQELIKKQQPVIDFLNETFNELVDITYIRSDVNIEREIVDLNKCTIKILNLLHAIIIESVADIQFDFSALSTIQYPTKYIESILFNLIENSLKYRSNKRLPHIRLKTYVKENWAYLEIKDNGIGIDLNKNGDKVFKLRKTFHDHPLARGYGLFLTKNHIESLGGTIDLKSTFDEGSTFLIRLCEIDKIN